VSSWEEDGITFNPLYNTPTLSVTMHRVTGRWSSESMMLIAEADPTV